MHEPELSASTKASVKSFWPVAEAIALMSAVPLTMSTYGATAGGEPAYDGEAVTEVPGSSDDEEHAATHTRVTAEANAIRADTLALSHCAAHPYRQFVKSEHKA
ncbi:hypothetical protein Ade02nite_24270 [Paractinoplanes deccanensis]|uniref:Uncharacterized protein n=1 Tax=Paractinoplanes deccanensis TaxID=113561 RepID=A0ABQ3Y1A5_9ACTN|nr:hypothetical protein Ade02nite_24270 [Actinoplanes deccanensis]